MNPIVPIMARIVITTINSTRVKALVEREDDMNRRLEFFNEYMSDHLGVNCKKRAVDDY